MQKWYLFLGIIGFALPNYFVALESIETGNILLYLHPMATIQGMFANRIASIFMLDLLWVVLVFFIWTYQLAQQHQIKGLYWLWLLTLLFGLGGGFPLFLYLLERKKDD